jgi:hypothetical protein
MSEVIQQKEFAILIDAYRKSLVRRYSQENLKNFPELSEFDRKIIDKLIEYFLELLYPPYESRVELDNAFHSLKSFVYSPSKFIGVMGNIGYAVVKFGKLLLSAIQAGIAALRSYLAAHKFEAELYKNALPLLKQGIDISEEKVFNSLIGQIPEPEATAFREQVVKLFGVLADRVLLEKIQEVMLHVIEKMESKPKLYTKDEIRGIRMGYEIIDKGKELFSELTPQQIQFILKGIDLVEKDFYERAAGLQK